MSDFFSRKNGSLQKVSKRLLSLKYIRIQYQTLKNLTILEIFVNLTLLFGDNGASR